MRKAQAGVQGNFCVNEYSSYACFELIKLIHLQIADL
jgi:hypothetical protein